MNIFKYKEVIHACRFCFMCRHMATTGNVTFRESDTPRGRALIADKILMDRESLKNPDYVNAFYRADLSASCRRHCVSSYDEASLTRAVREDIIESGLEPENVKKIAEIIRKCGNPFGETSDGIDVSGLPEKAGLLYYIDSYTLYKQPEIAGAFIKIMIKAGVAFTVLKEKITSGKSLYMLGYKKEAAEAARETARLVKKAGCQTLVCSCPATFDAFKNDYSALGVPLEKIKILHSSEYMLTLIKDGLISPQVDDAGKKTVYYMDSDYLKNYNNITEGPRELLREAGCDVKELGSNQEESYALGEGAVVFDVLNPAVLEKLRMRVRAKAEDIGEAGLAVASPYTKYAFGHNETKKINIKSVEEIIMERL